MHMVLMQRYGGVLVLRDPGALENALFRAPKQIHDELTQMFESGTFDFAHLEPWLRRFAEPST